jgi:hypothetical protein
LFDQALDERIERLRSYPSAFLTHARAKRTSS